MNLRVIKKDIEFLVSDFIDDCALFAMLHPEDKKIDEVEKLIGEACDLANGLIDRINQPEIAKVGAKVKGAGRKAARIAAAKQAKAYYTAVNADLLKSLDALCERLSALAKK